MIMPIDESRASPQVPSQQVATPIQGFLDVLALVTSSGPWSPALLAAVEIASRWNADLTACYVPVDLREQRPAESAPAAASLPGESEYERPDESLAFTRFALERGVAHASWTVTRAPIALTLRHLGAWHDLAVIERDIVDAAHIFDILAEGLLSARLPCILLPPRWSGGLAFDRIVIGWNGSFESARALRSALPLLRLARQVVLVNGELRTPDEHSTGVTEPDPFAYLVQHGVAAKLHHIQVPPDEAGLALLRHAHVLRADLLVMGAYGRSRIRERLLGGATRYVMANADMPVFMQH